ncbi:AlbA family DNA-binding domain-containing protein [Bradyrhizobium guangdongense]
MTEQFAIFKDRADLEKLLADGLIESLQVEFKASEALAREGNKPNELCVTVSAMANSAGGQIFYCINEAKKTNGPIRVDDGVVDPKVTREWIEQILISRVHPRMNGVRIDPIDLGAGKRGFVISVPQTQTGPHQAPDKRYYKRFELQACAMEDYEVRDVLRRSTTPQPFVTLTFPVGNKQRLVFGPNQEQSDAFPVIARISNRSAAPAHHAVIDIGFDTDLLLASQGNYESLGEFADNSGFTMNWYRRILSSPPMLPIFKEHTMAISPNDLHFYLRSSALNGRPFFDITVIVSAPGFSSEEHWAIQANGQTIVMHPPGTPMTDRSKG